VRTAPLLGIALALCCTFAAASPGHAARPARAVPSRAARPTTPAGYYRIVRAWHTPTPGKKPPHDSSGRPMLVLHGMYIDETAAIPAMTDDGGFYLDGLSQAAHVLREPATGNEHAVEPRTLDLLYRIQRHFDAQEIRVMSAYRTPVPGHGQGLHAKGRAVDFVVPGVEDADVARFAREAGFSGVGLYPIGSFVHVDTRERSYFWMDRSGPGHRSRERGILLDVARHADEMARARGEYAGTFAVAAADADAGAESEDEEEDED
jgi:uncharacterized protein YcbK (DUF882 family)